MRLCARTLLSFQMGPSSPLCCRIDEEAAFSSQTFFFFFFFRGAFGKPISGQRPGPLTRARSVILIASELRDSLGIGGFRAASRFPPCRGSAGCERAAAPLPTSITACQGIVRSRDGALGSPSAFGDQQKAFWHLAAPDVLAALPVWHSRESFPTADVPK